jgi:hypothetical protein
MKKIVKHHLSVVCCLVVIIMALACSSQKNVERIETDTTIDLSGRWNDTDSREVSEAIILDCLNHPWITNHMTTSEA